jgi:hypothetical protein
MSAECSAEGMASKNVVGVALPAGCVGTSTTDRLRVVSIQQERTLRYPALDSIVWADGLDKEVPEGDLIMPLSRAQWTCFGWPRLSIAKPSLGVFFPLLVFISTLLLSQTAYAASVTLAWDPSTNPSVTGYRIYWGTTSGSYTNSANAGNSFIYTVSGLNSGTTYYFVATCYTGTGAESGYSNQVSTTTPAAAPSKTTLSVTPAWIIADTADFNGDGKIDILWRNTATGQNVLWYMNGAEFSGSGTLPVVSDPNWKLVGKGDFNGDGKVDILWRNSANGSNAVWYMDGTILLSAQGLPAVPDQSWVIVGTGDFNADGKVDILWRNTANGANVVW